MAGAFELPLRLSVVFLLLSVGQFGHAAAKVVDITYQDFQYESFKLHDYVLVLFYTPWCSACKADIQALNSVSADRLDRVQLAKVDASKERTFSAHAGISRLPALALYISADTEPVLFYPADHLSSADSDDNAIASRRALISSFIRRSTSADSAEQEVPSAAPQLQPSAPSDASPVVRGLFLATGADVDAEQAFDRAASFLSTQLTVSKTRLVDAPADSAPPLVLAQAPGASHFSRYSGPWTPAAVTRFLQDAVRPALTPFDSKALRSYRQRGLSVLYVFTDSGHTELLRDVSEAVDSYRSVVRGFQLSAVEPSEPLRQFSVTVRSLPFVVLEDRRANLIRALTPRGGVTGATVVQLLSSCLSEDLPAGGEQDVNAISEVLSRLDLTAPAAAALQKHEPLMRLTDSSIRSVLYNSSADVLLKVFSPYCHHCTAFAPAYEEIAKTFQSDLSLIVAEFDATKFKVPKELPVPGYPTVLLFRRNDTSNPLRFSGHRGVKEVVKWVNEHRARPAPVPVKAQPLIQLDDLTYKSVLYNSTSDVLLKVFSPSCPHCVVFAPTFEEVAKVFAADPSIVVAELNAYKYGVPSDLPVQGLPTVLLFQHGASTSPLVFEGRRSVKELTQWVLDHRSTTLGGHPAVRISAAHLSDDVVHAGLALPPVSTLLVLLAVFGVVLLGALAASNWAHVRREVSALRKTHSV